MFCMTKADIRDIIHEKLGLSKQEAMDAVEVILETIVQTFVEGDYVKVPGFGTFTVRAKKLRKGRNPHTGEPVEIAPRRVVTFKASSKLKEALEQRQS